MRRLSIASAVLGMMAAACIDQVVLEPELTIPDRPIVTSSTTTTVTESGLSVSDCPTADDAFKLFCASYDLIAAHYVDEIGDEDLAVAARSGVESFDTEASSTPDVFSCVIPAAEFLQVCEEMADQRIAGTTTDEELVEAALRGMLAGALDPNSAYLTPQALRLVREDQSGEVHGIGALVVTEDPDGERGCSTLSDECALVIVRPLPNTPALAAGLLPGDRFIAVDGQPIDGQTIDEVTARVRGPEGTDVALTMERDGSLFDVTITRAAISIPLVESEVIVDGVGYISLASFASSAPGQVREALQDLLDAGVKSLILDLRANPGGSLDAAVRIASEFLEEGLVLRTIGRTDEESYEVVRGGVATDPGLNLVLLVDGGSASASEVVAGVLQESDRATVIGERTFGKNTVQQRFDLPNGGALKLTIARWVTPGGLDFGGTGIAPDIEVLDETLDDEDLVLERALELAGS